MQLELLANWLKSNKDGIITGVLGGALWFFVLKLSPAVLSWLVRKVVLPSAERIRLFHLRPFVAHRLLINGFVQRNDHSGLVAYLISVAVKLLFSVVLTTVLLAFASVHFIVNGAMLMWQSIALTVVTCVVMYGAVIDIGIYLLAYKMLVDRHRKVIDRDLQDNVTFTHAVNEFAEATRSFDRPAAPASSICPVCEGTGQKNRRTCQECDGSGRRG